MLRYWIANAKSGTVTGEVVLAGSGSLTTRLGGGTCSLDISLGHLVTRDGSNVDMAAVAAVHALVAAGRASVVATLGASVLGEWLIMDHDVDTSSTTIAVSGMTWEGYPALRSLNANHLHSGVSQATIAKALLDQAFVSFNAGMQITIPAWSSGVTRSTDYRSHEAYYSDVMDEISSPDDGFEWCADVTGSWSGDRLDSVTRTVAWGAPILARSSPVIISAGEPGTRHGNGTIRGGTDFALYAQSVYGIGEGSGDKQVWVGLSDPTLTNAGYLNSTKNVSFPGITDLPTLTALTQAELTRAQNLAKPFRATATLDYLPEPPRVGTLVRLISAPTYAYPSGLDVSLRVGQVAYSPTGPTCETVSIIAA